MPELGADVLLVEGGVVPEVVVAEVELCAKADVIGDRTKDAINAPTIAFFAQFTLSAFRLGVWRRYKKRSPKIWAKFAESTFLRCDSNRSIVCLHGSIPVREGCG